MASPARPLYVSRAYKAGNRRAVVLLGGWQTWQWQYRLPARALLRRGYDCIVYTYRPDVFSPNAPATVANLSTIAEAVFADVRELKSQGYQEISILGFSLGTMIACMVADRSVEITKVILNLTSTEPAACVWTWDNIRHGFKTSLVHGGLTLDRLQVLWAPIAPINNLHNAQGKQFLVYLAKHDRMMAYDQAKEIIAKIEQAGAQAELVTNVCGSHVVAGFYNLLNTKRYVRFLNS